MRTESRKLLWGIYERQRHKNLLGLSIQVIRDLVKITLVLNPQVIDSTALNDSVWDTATALITTADL